MNTSEFTILSRHCEMFSSERSEILLIQPVDESDAKGLSEEISAIRARTDRPFALAAFHVEDWNEELAPWEAPPVFGKAAFGSGAEATLDFMERGLLPEVRSRLGLKEDAPVVLGGYSLAAFFALWAAYRSGSFSAAACASPSVWFPGWLDFARARRPKARRVYISLGDREERVKNPVMATVGCCIRGQFALLQEALGEDNCTLEWNEGNHFKDPALRTAKAFAWCVERTLTEDGK